MSYQEMKALSGANPFNTDADKAREIYNWISLGSDPDASYVGTATSSIMNAYARSGKFSDLKYLAAHHAMGVLDRAAESYRLTRKARFHRLVGGNFLQYALGIENAYENTRMSQNIDREVNKRAVENLIRAGAFDSFGAFRSQLIAVSDKLLDSIAGSRRQNVDGQMDFFGMSTQNAGRSGAGIQLPNIPEFALDERMRQIAVSLYESGGYKGSCYFVKTGEKVILGY